MNGGVEQAKVDWEANAPRSVFFDDIYFSGDGLEETRHVFLAGNDLASRFSERALNFCRSKSIRCRRKISVARTPRCRISQN